MNQKIKLSQGIQCVIIGIAILTFLCIWPWGIIRQPHTSKSEEVQATVSLPISVENNATQMFLAEGSYLKYVDLYVLNEMQGETITFRIYDGEYQQLWETFYAVDMEAKLPGFVRIPVGLDMEEEGMYYYTVEGLTRDLYLSYETLSESSSYANGTLTYGGGEVPDMNIIIRYHYADVFAWWMVLVAGLLLGTAAFVLCWAIDNLSQKKYPSWEAEVSVQRVIQCVGNPVVALGACVALFAVFPGRVFGTGMINYGFYYLGILLTAAVLLFGINYKREGSEPMVNLGKIKERWPEWAMAVCLSGVLWSCYEYMNGLYDIHHSYATCKLLIWFGLAFLFTFRKEEILRIWNLLYLIPACVGGYFYAKPYSGIEEQGELYKLQAYVMIVMGMVCLQLIISTIGMIRKKQKPEAEWNWLYLGCLALLLGLMVIFRNTREWPVLTAVIFGAFYYRMWLWEKRDRLLEIFSNAILLNFLYTVGYCLLHRPYHRYRFTRFGMNYHTVTMTGYYLALVLCAVMVRLFVQYRRKNRWQDCWKELSLLGMGNVYLFLTLSRTGYLAAYVMEVFFVVFMTCIHDKKKIIGSLQKFAVVMAVSVVFFPIVFTWQRILPAVSNDPVYSEIELWEYTIEKGEPKNSDLYIDVPYFAKLAAEKLFNKNLSALGQSKDVESLVYAAGISTPLASNPEDMDTDYDMSNGRLDIFREYIGHWNLTGHEEMGVPFPNGEISTHAHNIYLQMIHDHGLITGIVFLIFGLVSFVWSIWRCIKYRQRLEYQELTLAVLFAFALAGCVEWIFHICNPFGFSVFMVIVPLLFVERQQ